jgi:hypothetical protein
MKKIVHRDEIYRGVAPRASELSATGMPLCLRADAFPIIAHLHADLAWNYFVPILCLLQQPLSN